MFYFGTIIWLYLTNLKYAKKTTWVWSIRFWIIKYFSLFLLFNFKQFEFGFKCPRVQLEDSSEKRHINSSADHYSYNIYTSSVSNKHLTIHLLKFWRNFDNSINTKLKIKTYSSVLICWLLILECLWNSTGFYESYF